MIVPELPKQSMPDEDCRQLCSKTERLTSEECEELVAFAESASELDARKAYAKVLKDFLFSSYHYYIFRRIVRDFRDIDRAENICKDILARDGSGSLYPDVAELVCGRLKDREWAREICSEAEKLNIDSTALISLADTVYELFRDSEWCGKLLERTMNFELSSYEYVMVAEMMIEVFGDIEKARQCLKKAVETAENSLDLCLAADAVMKELGDREWCHSIIKDADGFIRDATDAGSVAEAILKEDGLNDREWGIRVLFRAEEFMPLDEIDKIILREVAHKHGIKGLEELGVNTGRELRMGGVFIAPLFHYSADFHGHKMSSPLCYVDCGRKGITDECSRKGYHDGSHRGD